MIARFDTPELAEKRFMELKEEHKPRKTFGDFCFELDLGDPEEEEQVTAAYWLRTIEGKAEIEMYVGGYPVKRLITAMKIVDLMSEV